MGMIDLRQVLWAFILLAIVHDGIAFINIRGISTWRGLHIENAVTLKASMLPPPPSVATLREKVKAQTNGGHLNLVFIPFLSAVISYFGYEGASGSLHSFIEIVSRRTWESADGGKLAASFLAPSINGPMIACVSILFGTLVSTTISNLYNRQETIRCCVAQEVEEIRFICQMLEGLEGDLGVRAKLYLDEYAHDLLECVVLGEPSDQYAIQSSKPLRLFVAELDKLIHNSHDPDSPVSVPGAILSGTLDAVTRINTQRAVRISSINSTFPVTHYLLLTVLASAICLAFLIETDVDALFFVADTQLRLLWGALVGTLACLAVVCYDLSYPFTGFYRVTGSSDEQVLQYLAYAMNSPPDEILEELVNEKKMATKWID